jgi:superfamily II DNA or RNA helicase
MAKKKEWRSFEEAREFARGLGLKGQREWRDYCKSGNRPEDIPMNPDRAYSSEFQGYGDWLGTGRRRGQWRPFDEARDFARRLGLKSESEWRDYCKSDEKPNDIPSAPNQVYNSEFKGMGDWLGTGYVAARDRQWRPFSEARDFIRNLGLKNEREWRDYCKSDEKPDNIPSRPERAYGTEYQGMGDWLGTGFVHANQRRYRSFEEAREFVQRLGFKNAREWRVYSRSGQRPDDIPSEPNQVYDSKFKGYGDWLGTGFVDTRERRYRSFTEAREFVQKLGLKNAREWEAYSKTDEKPNDIPQDPRQVYGSDFEGYGDWLGTGFVHRKNRKYRLFAKVREFVRRLNLKNESEWLDYCRAEKKPTDIPQDPRKIYRSEFKSMGDWLGAINKWNKNALLAFLSDLRPRLPYLEESELYTILQQGGALPALDTALGKGSPMQVLKDLKYNAGRRLEQAIRGISEGEIAAYVDDGIVDEGVAERGNPATLFHRDIFESEAGESANLGVHPVVDETPLTVTEKGLPRLATKEGLRLIDSLAGLPYGLDDDAAEYLVANRVSALWERYISEGRGIVDELLVGDGGRWFTEIKTRFLSEVEGVENLVVPKGWSFAVNGRRTLPNAMQQRTAWAVREKRRVGNWSGVGAGKTLSAVLASRVIGAYSTLIVTNNATVEGWRRQIKQAYPDSVVHTHVDDSLTLDRDHHNYIVLNYEKFQTSGRDHLVHLLLGLRIDFIVFDEVQFVKQRDKDASNRRKALEALVCGVTENNPDLRVMGMSATPVINNLLEAKKLLEIVTGVQFPELDTQATVNNALAMHRALMLHGFRYRPRYEQEMRTEVVTTSRNDLLEPLRNIRGNVLSVEQLLLPAKLEAARGHFRKGTIVYTHYVDDMVAPTRRYLEDMGLRVGLFIGSDKSGLEPFLKSEVDILIGTKPVGTGLDGLQSVCNQLIMMCLPWTSAEYEQIIGRIRRQGSAFGEVEVIVPQVTLDYEGDTWSWDQGRMACIQYKRTLSDCAVDGYIPETVRINQNELLKQSREALDRWIERIGERGVLAIERERLTVPLPPDIRHAAQVRHGDFTILNNRWSTSRSSTTYARLQEDPSEWHLYHTLYREAREGWPEQPFEWIAERIRVRSDWVVGDFGCGECLLSQALPNNRVIGLDHIGWDENVTSCDMSATPLKDASLDVAVFSLSLMGVNWTDYLKEAHRTLKPYGHLFIAEPKKKWQDRIEELKDTIEAAGFRTVGDVEQRYGFLYLTAVKA